MSETKEQQQAKSVGIAARHMNNAANHLSAAGHNTALTVLLALINCVRFGPQHYGPQLQEAVKDYLA